MKGRKYMIYSCFAGLGKTTIAKNNKSYVDLESSDYQWLFPKYIGENREGRKGVGGKTKNPAFPINYVDDMEKILKTGKKVLISSQPEVLKEVNHRGLAFITVTPSNNLKDEYIERYKRRGNNQNFIELMSKNFDTFSGELAKNSKATANIVVRKENTYLSDIL